MSGGGAIRFGDHVQQRAHIHGEAVRVGLLGEPFCRRRRIGRRAQEQRGIDDPLDPRGRLAMTRMLEQVQEQVSITQPPRTDRPEHEWDRCLEERTVYARSA